MPAQGKTNASRVTTGDRILVYVEGDYREVSRTKTGPGVQVARVTGKTMAGGRYYLETSAGPVKNLAPIQTMWLAPEDAAGIKRAHVEALKEDQDRDHAEKVRAQLRTATTEALEDALTDAPPSLAALIQEELDFRHQAAVAEMARAQEEGLVERAQAGVAEALDRLAPALKAEALEPEVTAEAALAAIGGCWAGGALTGKALKHYHREEYPEAYRVAQDQKNLQARQEVEGGQEAIHPEHRRGLDPDVARSLEAVADGLPHAYAHVGTVAGAGEVYVAPMGTPEPTPEDLSDLAAALAEEDLEHLEPEEVRAPKAKDLRCVPGDVVTIHRGTRLYEVLRVEEDFSRNNLTGDVADQTMARVAPCDPEDLRDPQWVHVDLLHVQGPVARLQTVESRYDRRVRYALRVVELPDGTLRRPALMVTDPQRQPSAHLMELGEVRWPASGPVVTLRHGDAITLDGRTFRYVDGALEPARWRDRLPVS